MSIRTRFAILLVSVPVLIFTLVGGFIDRAAAREDTVYKHLRVFEDVVSLITNSYVEDVDVDKVMQGAMRGLAEGLDPDSAYLQPKEVRVLEQGEKLADGDVGVELTRQYYLRVIAARDDSPAARAGLSTGDYIRAIDGKSTRDMSVFTGTRALRGAPGSKVSLIVIRGNAAEPHNLELVREKEAVPEVASKVVAPQIGYVRIAAFGPRTSEQLKSRVDSLAREGATSLIVDLRRTAEGPLESGLAAARLFVRSGTLAIREGHGETREPLKADAGDSTITLPSALLVNTGTSGAAELFAAALAGNKRAEVIGEHTLGRTATQKLVRLPDGSGLWISVTRYLTPSGTPIHGKGIEPNVEIEEPEREFGAAPAENDPMLEKAVERLSVKKAA